MLIELIWGFASTKNLLWFLSENNAAFPISEETKFQVHTIYIVSATSIILQVYADNYLDTINL